ncbi:MAG: metallophosphoesterase [Bacteroidota bacterium]
MQTRFSTYCWLLLLLGACAKSDTGPAQAVAFKVQTSVPFSFAIIGDYGEAGTPARRVSELVQSWSPEFIITLGDNNYDDGKLSSIKDNISQYYCDYIYNPDAPKDFQCAGRAAQEQLNRFFPTLGNHGYYNARKAAPYLSFFTLPNRESYYDVQWGPVHLFSINSGADGEAGCCDSEQAYWLEQQLRQSEAAFKLVYFHHPPYSESYHGNNENLQWPFAAWGASAVLSGHEHVYQRIHHAEHPALPYFVNGLGGRDKIYACGHQPLDPQRFSNFCYNDDFGAMRATVRERSILFEFFTVNSPDQPIDQYEVFAVE